MSKKIISFFIVCTILCGIFTYSTMLPDLDVIRRINIMEIVKLLNLPERTVFYINKIFSSEKGTRPVSPKEDRSRQEKVLRFLIISIMTAILIPATYSLAGPYHIAFSDMLSVSTDRGRAPPAYSSARHNPPDRNSRQNKRRERHSASVRTVSEDSDSSGCSDNSSEYDLILRSIFNKDKTDRYFNRESRSGSLYMFDKDGNKIYRSLINKIRGQKNV